MPIKNGSKLPYITNQNFPIHAILESNGVGVLETEIERIPIGCSQNKFRDRGGKRRKNHVVRHGCPGVGQEAQSGGA